MSQDKRTGSFSRAGELERLLRLLNEVRGDHEDLKFFHATNTLLMELAGELGISIKEAAERIKSPHLTRKP